MFGIVGRRAVAASAVATMVALLSACGGSEGAGAEGPLKIGTSLPLTGEFSQAGEGAERGYRVWEEMVNEDGGILGRDVELIIKDDASNQNTVVADYNALISQDKVDLLLGTFSSLLNLPASAIAERHGMLFVEAAGGAPELFSRGFKHLFFTQQATVDRQGEVFANWMAELPEEKRPKTAAYPVADDPFAEPNVAGIKAILEAAGIETVYEEKYPLDLKNFDTIANGVKQADPDLVVQGAIFEDGVNLIRSFLKVGFKPDWLYQTAAPSVGEQYAEAVGVENTEGVLFAVSHAPQAETPGNAEFVAAYQKAYDELPPEDAADAYASGQVLQAAVEAVGDINDQEAMADWLRENSVDTILGELSWNEDGSPNGEYLIGQWQDGAVEFILPTEVASTKKIVDGWHPAAATR